MSITNTPIAGTGSNVDPGTPADGLEPEESLPAGDQVPDGSTPPADGGEPITPELGKEGQEQVTESKEDGRVIPAWMRALKDSNPEAYKRARTDLFELRDRRSVHPTAQAAREEHDLVESLGGADGVASMREEFGFFSDAAKQFLKGDPTFVQDLAEEDPIAFGQMVPSVLETYKTRDLEGYKSVLANRWAEEFKNINFGAGLKALADAIKRKDFDSALQLLEGENSFTDWYNSILDVARKAEDPRVKSLLAERTKVRESEEQKQQEEFLKSYRTETTNMVVDEAAKVFDSFFKTRKLDPEDRTDLLRESLGIANRAVLTDKDFIAQRDRHLKAGDAKAAQQLTKARYAREYTEAVKRVARRYGYVSGTPGTNQTRQNQQQPPGGGQQPPQGWVVVNARPDPTDINREVTTNEMILSGRAILKSGKKIDWSKLKK